MTIYVVRGQTGEYSDRSEWLVKAFRTVEETQAFIIKCDAIAKQLFIEYKNSRWSTAGLHPYDKKFLMDYTGTNYSYDEIDLEDQV